MITEANAAITSGRLITTQPARLRKPYRKSLWELAQRLLRRRHTALLDLLRQIIQRSGALLEGAHPVSRFISRLVVEKVPFPPPSILCQAYPVHRGKIGN